MEELREKFFAKVKELKDLNDFSNFGTTRIVEFGCRSKTGDDLIYSIVDWGNVFNWFRQYIEENYVPKPKDKSELPINLTEQYVKTAQAGINEVNKALGLK